MPLWQRCAADDSLVSMLIEGCQHFCNANNGMVNNCRYCGGQHLTLNT